MMKCVLALAWHWITGSVKSIINVKNEHDTRPGITALADLEANDSRLASNIAHFLKQLQRIEAQQYCYPSKELHLSVLSIISCVAGFKSDDINPKAYIQNVLSGLLSHHLALLFKVSLLGIVCKAYLITCVSSSRPQVCAVGLTALMT